jgi:acetyltransferase-like isoleucine patch superfamily enzyme
MYFNTPILFLIFNRLDVAKQVFSEIRKAQPKQLFIAADGGRTAEEHLICAKIRQSILDMIDWKCEVHTNFREENAGCGKNVSEAITWFFEHVEEGIILEDDCLPCPSFFNFCQDNLEKHRENNKIFSINGTCLEEDDSSIELTYQLSKYPLIWGWATWRRAWKKYHYKWEDNESNKNIFKNHFVTDEAEFWISILEKIGQNKIDTWDYQWCFSVWSNQGQCIQPNHNLISNIGFDKHATHTKLDTLGLANRPNYIKYTKTSHPENLIVNHKKDRILYSKYFNPPPPIQKENSKSSLLKRLKQNLVNRLVSLLSNYFEAKSEMLVHRKNNKFNIKLEENSFIEGVLTIENGPSINIKKNSSIGKFAWIAAIQKYGNQRFEKTEIIIGENTRIGNFCCITAINSIQIGNGVLISDYFYTSDHAHGFDPQENSPVDQALELKGDVFIGDNCFIGMRVSILPGVTLGNNCVVGAHSVVTKSYPPYTMLSGVPAKAIKIYNFETRNWEQIQKDA